MTKTYSVTADLAGRRLDQFLCEQDPDLSRSQLKRHIDDGLVTVNGDAAKPSRKLKLGDRIEYAPPEVQPTDVVAQDILLEVLFEDKDLIVINKPAGLVVHPAPGHATGTLVNALLFHCDDLSGIGGEIRPGIVHRLDKDTSGTLVAAKNDWTHKRLSTLFKDKNLLRLYRAIVAPPPRLLSGTIETLHGRHPRDRKKFTSKVTEGKTAVTHWKVVETFGTRASLLECRLDTGRTHQIRVHLSEHGFPVLGDPMYARRPADHKLAVLYEMLGRQALHASVLSFVHPRTGETIDMRTELPSDMQRVVDELRALSA